MLCSGQRYAEDFEVVRKALDLRTPVLVAWSAPRCPPPPLTDALLHAPGVSPAPSSATSSRTSRPSRSPTPSSSPRCPGARSSSEISLPAVLAALGGLLSPDAAQSCAGMRAFVDLIFRDPAAVPYGKRLMYYSHDVDPAMLQVITAREQDREKLRIANEEGLPLMMENGTGDGHQRLWIMLEYLKKWLGDLEAHIIEGGSYPLYEDHPDETIGWIFGFVKGVYGKDYRLNKTA